MGKREIIRDTVRQVLEGVAGSATYWVLPCHCFTAFCPLLNLRVHIPIRQKRKTTERKEKNSFYLMEDMSRE